MNAGVAEVNSGKPFAIFWGSVAQVVCVLSPSSTCFFFHEYGRRVGMVPRSSLKEGKYNQMVEKRTKITNQTNQPTANQSPQAEFPPSCSLSSVLR